MTFEECIAAAQVHAKQRGHKVEQYLLDWAFESPRWYGHCTVCGGGLHVEYCEHKEGLYYGGTAIRRTCQGVQNSKIRSQHLRAERTVTSLMKRIVDTVVYGPVE